MRKITQLARRTSKFPSKEWEDSTLAKILKSVNLHGICGFSCILPSISRKIHTEESSSARIYYEDTMALHSRISIFFFATALSYTAVFAQLPSKEQVTTQVLVGALENSHYAPVGVNDTLSRRAFRLYLDRLDYNKNFLLQKDVDALRTYEFAIDNMIEAGTSELYPLAVKIMAKRLEQTQAYCEEILSQPFDFNQKETIELDAKKRPYPVTEAAQRDWWRKLLKYQTLTRVVAAMEQQEKDTSAKAGKKSLEQLEKEAREKVLKAQRDRYKRSMKETETEKLAVYLNAIAASYDPHTDFYPPKEKENFDIEMSGTLEGIGATLQETDGFIKVQSLVPGGPAWKQKELQAEDLILRVKQGTKSSPTVTGESATQTDDNEFVDITDMRLDDAVRLIRGKKGTQVTLTIKKPSGVTTDITITRDVVVIEETFAKSVILKDEQSGKEYAYINLPKFYADFNRNGGRSCAEDVRKELEKIKEENVGGVILDLRNNGGGSLQDVVKMSGLFIKDGPIVQVLSSDRPADVLRDYDKNIVYDGNVIVLVNQFSASASEILSAALQDYGRAVIVGTPHSFGKGTVQTFIDLNNYLNNEFKQFAPLGSLKITFQKFYRITGESTQFKGVTPDIILPDAYEFIDVGEKQLEYPLAWDTIPRQQFAPWTKSKLSIKELAEKSKKRISDNSKFALVRKQAQTIKQRRDETIEPESLDEYRAEQERMKAENKELDALKTEIPGIATRSLKADEKTELPEQKEKNDDWYKQIRKDITIAEAIAILNDMNNASAKN